MPSNRENKAFNRATLGGLGVLHTSEIPGPPKERNIMDPMMPIVSIVAYWAIILGSFGGPGKRAVMLFLGNSISAV